MVQGIGVAVLGVEAVVLGVEAEVSGVMTMAVIRMDLQGKTVGQTQVAA